MLVELPADKAKRTEALKAATAVESEPARAARITANAHALGVPHLDVVTGRAPAALDGLRAPDAIFIGGGITTEGLLDTCWEALTPGGRLVANTVTLEGELVVADARARWGGELTRIELAHAGAVGRYTAWRPQLPVVQLTTTKAP